jgi:enamine deaminase RidA (YjgF/YER057c/UK114 family)
MINYEARMRELGVQVPELPPAAGAYAPAIRSGNLVFCSGQGPYRNGAMAFVGRVGREVSPEQAYQAARIAVLNCLAEACKLLGSVNAIRRIVQVRGFVNSAPDFHEQPKVLNGASDLLLEIFGEEGRHARAALGTSNLPSNIPVEVELVVEAR